MREIRIVGDFTHKKPFMIVEYFKGKNHYVGHKVLSRFQTEEECVKELNNNGGKK